VGGDLPPWLHIGDGEEWEAEGEPE